MDLFSLYQSNPFWNLLILVSPHSLLGQHEGRGLVLLNYLSIVKNSLFVEKLVVWSQVWSAVQLQCQRIWKWSCCDGFLGHVGR